MYEVYFFATQTPGSNIIVLVLVSFIDYKLTVFFKVNYESTGINRYAAF